MELRLCVVVVGLLCSVNAQSKYDELKAQAPEYTKFTEAIDLFSLKGDLEYKKTKTVVAPTNKAFKEAEVNKIFGAGGDDDKFCIMAHLLTGDTPVTKAELGTRLKTVDALPWGVTNKRNGNVYFSKVNDSYYANNAKLNGYEKELMIGGLKNVIQGVDKVICPYFPVKLYSADANVGTYLKNNGGTKFNELLKAYADNRDSSVPNNFLPAIGDELTVFVPTDNFLKDPNVQPYLDPVLEELKKKENVTELEKVIFRHFMLEKFLATEFMEYGKEYKTHGTGLPMKFSEIPATSDQAKTVVIQSGETKVNIAKPNQFIANGVAHNIEAILGLVYKNNYAEVMTNTRTTLFKELVGHAEDTVKVALKKKDPKSTVFAVDNLSLEKNPKVTNLKQPENKAKLTKALQMAIAPDKAYTLADLKKMNGQKIKTLNGDVDVVVENNMVSIVGGGVKARIIEQAAGVQTTNGIVHILDQMLSVGSDSVYDIIGQDVNLSTVKKLFDDFNLKTTIEETKDITVIAATNQAFTDARKKSTKLDVLLKVDRTKLKTNAEKQEYDNDMKNFLTLFILKGTPTIEQGMSAVNVKAIEGAKKEDRIVGFEGKGAKIMVKYKEQELPLMMPFVKKIGNGQLVVTNTGVLFDEKNIKTGAITGAATMKLHTGLALVIMLIVMKFWL